MNSTCTYLTTLAVHERRVEKLIKIVSDKESRLYLYMFHDQLFNAP